MAFELNKFVKLHSMTSSTGLTLNGRTGALGQWHENWDMYEVFVGSPQRRFMVKLENMYVVEPRMVIVWSTIVFPDSSSFDPNACWSFHQGVALEDGASPWHCSLDALELYGPYELIVEVPVDISQIPSTVEIVELESDEEVDAHFDFEFVPSSELVLHEV